jgi:hypothetical protein
MMRILNKFTSIIFKKNFFYSYVHTMFGSFLPPSPHRLSYPPLPPFTPCSLAETILFLSLILLKKEYKQ